jgi:hypothetical protein
MADDHDEEPGGNWPRGLGEDVRGWADPADPMLPAPDPTGATERRVARRLAGRLPSFGSPELKPIQFADAYARLTAVACARAEFYGELLAQQYEREGIGGLVGHKYSAVKDIGVFEASEEARGLARLEAEERDRAAKLIREGVRLGIEAKQVDVMRSYGQTVVAALRQLCQELGIPWEEESRRAAMRAILAARTMLGQQVVTADRAGPPLSDQERRRLLGGGGDVRPD